MADWARWSGETRGGSIFPGFVALFARGWKFKDGCEQSRNRIVGFECQPGFFIHYFVMDHLLRQSCHDDRKTEAGEYLVVVKIGDRVPRMFLVEGNRFVVIGKALKTG